MTGAEHIFGRFLILRRKSRKAETMVYSLFRYYYFLEDDTPDSQLFLEALKSAGFQTESAGYFIREATDHEIILQTQPYGNMDVWVLKLHGGDGNWKQYISLAEEWESETGLKKSDLLAEITVLAADAGSWDSLENTLRELCTYQELLEFPLAGGRLARMGWRWPKGKAYYLFSGDSGSRPLDHLLTAGLPLLEAAWIRLNLISHLFRDRNQTIQKEKLELDQQLSQILHTQLVSESAPLKEVEELEQQIQQLSAAYGILAGDYSSITNSCGQLMDLIGDVQRQIQLERSFRFEPVLIDTMLASYREILDQLQKTTEEIKTSRENHQAAIDVVRSRIDIMLSRENISTQSQIRNLMELNTTLQRQSLTFQVAAGIIEFIILAYYSHSLWKNLAHSAYELVPSWLQFIIVVLFSANTVYCTHLLAEYKQGEHHVKKELLLSAVPLILICSIIIIGSIVLETATTH